MGVILASEDPLHRNEVQYEVAFKLALISRRFRARFAERFKSSSQTEARWSALYQLAREPGGLIQSELAERMGIQGPTLVRLLDALEAQGLVRRLSAPEDRRAKRVMIQPAGEQMVKQVDVIAAQLRDDAFAGISIEDMLVTLRVLETLGVRLNPDADSVTHGETSRARSTPAPSE
ncbi:MAG: MarR family transcriptional regulator [Hyphomonadaceae bacterium]